MTGIRSRAALAALAATVGLAACGGAPHQSSLGGNNAPRDTIGVPASSSPTTAPPRPTTTTRTPATAPATTTTTAPGTSTLQPGTVITLPGGVSSAFGTPQKGKPWLTPGTAEHAAAAWTVAYHELLWTQPEVNGSGYGYYIHRIAPWSTPAWLATLAAPVTASETSGTTDPAENQAWAQIVHTQTDKTVQIIEANRVDQAGWTATSEIVQVAFYYQVTTAIHPNPQPGLEIGFTTDYLTMSKIGGRWLVAHEINALDQ